MKKNLNVGGLREGNDLRVCRQSSKISKSSCFQVKISQQGALLESSIQNHQDVASNIELLVRENGSDEDIATQDSFAGATLNIRKSPLSSFDSSYVEISGSLPAACPSILETIFSPIIESKEGNCSTKTLVHSTLEYCDNADFTFSVYFNMKEHIIYVRQRPHLQMFLKRVAEMFEIIVFTASQSIYAEKLLNILDPDSKLISRRFYRESCIFSNGNYVKDLTILGLDLAKVAIIDNSPQVFQLQVNNGIPIESWFEDPSDHALMSVLPFLETLVDVDDVRPIIAQRFNND
eukprot:TRINITY_DN830_c0_g2_i1.p1 TRINITY_DN830_c0_g2~~TRINITY_DN830_c0_g2_i1.p1  ORF type:complete len:291 (-),score=51.47 TRINITY_DN830_c0_g2_i1:391-1263(-)